MRRRLDRFKKNLFRFDLQGRLVAGFVIATCLTGSIATVISIWTINRSTIAEVQNRVRQDIHSVQLIYDSTLDRISSLLQFAAEAYNIAEIIQGRGFHKMDSLAYLITHQPESGAQEKGLALDMLTVLDAKGIVIYRAANPPSNGDSMMWDPIVRNCIEKKAPVSSTELYNVNNIVQENPHLAERLNIEIVQTPLSAVIKEKQLSEGMVLRAAYPIVNDKGNLVGVLTGGLLLNNDTQIVDKVRATVYRGEMYKGREMGAATIFQGGVRIATNVTTNEGKRAIGTILSKTVYDLVIKEGKAWTGRAFVVNDWYITTYTPIYNMDRRLIGVLFTGLLESKYRDIEWRTIMLNICILIVGMLLAFIISFRLGNTIITRIRVLKEASEAIASGNLDHKVAPDRASGFDMLDKAFNNMAKSLKDRDQRLSEMHEQMVRTEKLSALGAMAAGVAHEINNPLGGILLYSNIVLEDLPPENPARENVEKIIAQTNRCKLIVQDLLHFARMQTGQMESLGVNDLIHSALNLVRDQALFKGIELEVALKEDLPEFNGDRMRLEEVFINLFVNAADAMEGKGKLSIRTRRKANGIEIVIADTGKGIEPRDLPHIFEPFFTTKDPGKGTGLGLSIAYSVIKHHQGTIDAVSDPGEGAKFIITLPVGTDLARKEAAGIS